MTDTPNPAQEAAREATEAMCLAVIADVELAEQMWPDLPPVMQMLVVLAHRELMTRKTVTGRTLMDTWPDSFTREMTDEEIDRMVRGVVHDYVYPELSGLGFEHN
jgi:hypothetical protein